MDLGYLGIYLLTINFIGFLMVALDKHKARKDKWRVPEKRFFLLGVIGGAIGIYIGMQLFRHKTQHKTFTLGIPILIIVNLIVIIYIIQDTLTR